MALETLMKTPLLIWRRRRSWRILRGLGAMLLILRGGPSSAPSLFPQDSNAPLDTHDKVDLGLGRDVEVTLSLRDTLEADLLALLLLVLVDVLLGTLEDDLALGLADLRSPTGVSFCVPGRGVVMSKAGGGSVAQIRKMVNVIG